MYLFLDYLEVLLGAIFIGVFCDVEQKNRYCLISSIISFFVMEIMQTYDLFGNEMAYVLAITNFVIVSIVKKEVKFYNFIPCILFTWISVFTSTIVLFFFKVITNYNIENIIKLYRIPIIFLARIIFLVLIVVLNYFKTKIKDTIIEKNKYLLNYIFILSIIIPIILSIFYSYTSDFQPQGRYIMGIIIPFTYFIVNGIQKILEKFVKSEKIRKGIVLVIMLLIIVISMKALFGYIIPRYR